MEVCSNTGSISRQMSFAFRHLGLKLQAGGGFLGDGGSPESRIRVRIFSLAGSGIGTADNKAGIVSFELDGVHAHDIGTILDREGIAVRVGHHCAQPLMERFNITGTVRASFGLYNNKADIDALVAALGAVREIFD